MSHFVTDIGNDDGFRRDMADSMQKTLDANSIDYVIPGSSADVDDRNVPGLINWINQQQEALNKFSISTAKEVYKLQQEADERGMQFSADEAQKLRDWQTEQSNTAYQRAAIDMRKAGLNPALMFANGSAASTPSGGMGSGISSARQIPQLNLENYAYQFKALVESLESTERNTDKYTSATKYAATINAASQIFTSLVNTGQISFKSKSRQAGFGG